MKVEVFYQPAYSVARVTLASGEPVRAESGAMVAMDSHIQIETKATGGFLKSLSRSVLGGESFFQNTFTSGAEGGQIFFAPDLPGDIITHEMTGTDMLVQSGSYLASDINIQVDSKWGGAKTFFGGEGLFMLKCSGQGTLIISSFGAIHKATLEAGQQYTVDTGHIVAFPAAMQYNLRKVGSWKSTIFGGEGIVVDFTGPGDVFLQTRSPESFLGWLIPNLPRDNNN
jgi:uncharacterized protein (TIGR00266 family)